LDTRTESLGTLVRYAGIVLQNPLSQLSGVRYTVLEEVAFGLENLGVPPAQIAGRAANALEQVGLSGLEARSPHSLSGGQQQRLALASILALAPQVFVLDEPTSMLDPAGCREVFEAIAGLSRQGAAVVIAEHRLEWIAEYATRVVALSHGRVILDGPPRQALASPQLLEAGIGWTRYTHAAHQARERGLWPAHRPLPVTLAEAIDGFSGVH
jgi:energy-coupling factor transporter ATP-binding protein EcfA2